MRCDEDAYFGGSLGAKTFLLSAGCVSDSHVAGNAAIATSKMLHRFRRSYMVGGTVATVTVPLHFCCGLTGTVLAIAAGLITPNVGAATVTVDLKKNGSSILASVITLNSSSTARSMSTATITSNTVAQNDFFELVITATAGGGTVGQGLLVQADFDETPV